MIMSAYLRRLPGAARTGRPRLRLIPLVEPVVERSFVLLRRRTTVLSPPARELHDLILARTGVGKASR